MKQINLKGNALSIFLLILLASIWGGSFIFIKIALDTISPLTIAASRIFIAAVFLLIIVRLYGYSLPKFGMAWIFIVCAAVFGNVLPFTLISYGEVAIDSSLASILMSTIPLFNIIIAHMFTSDDKVTFVKVVGVLIGFYGIVMLVGFDYLAALGNEALHQLMVVCGALCYAISGVLSRNLKSMKKLPVSAAILTVASVLIVPMAVVYDQPWHLTPSAGAISSVLMLGILSTAAAQLLILKILQLRDSSFLALNNYLVPIFGVIWGMLILAERPDMQTLISFSIILLGVFVSQLDITYKNLFRFFSSALAHQKK